MPAVDLVPVLLTTIQRLEHKVDRLLLELEVDMGAEETSLDDLPEGLQPDTGSLDG